MENLGLDSNLLLQIKDLLKDGQADADIKQISHELAPFELNVAVFWLFGGEYEDENIAGGFNAKTHFGYDLSEFNQHTAYLSQNARNGLELRTDFINQLTAMGGDVLRICDKTALVHSFEPYSVATECEGCGGGGVIECEGCKGAGYVECPTCSGTGRVARTQSQKDDSGKIIGAQTIHDTCTRCHGKGKLGCHHCSGSGMKQCERCGGQGHFMLTRKFNVYAKPDFLIEVVSDSYRQELEDFLKERSCALLSDKIDFNLVSQTTQRGDVERFLYSGESVMTEIKFSIKDRIYTCVGFANPPIAFVKPAIFDDVFRDEISLLERIALTGKVGKNEAAELFERCASQPVLDKILKDIVANRKDEQDDVSSIVIGACDGFVSKDCARKFSSLINKTVDKISPVYSNSVWNIGIAVCVIAAFLYTAVVFGQDLGGGALYHAATTALKVAIGASVAAAGLSGLSLLATSMQRAKIPAEYRQKMRNKEPLKRMAKFVAIATIAGLIYGFAAQNGYAYKIGQNFSFLNPEQVLDKIEYEQVEIKTIEKESNLTQKEKTAFIQDRLKQSGYDIKADGIMGSRTQNALNDYFSKIGVDKPKSVDEIYEYMRNN